MRAAPLLAAMLLAVSLAGCAGPARKPASTVPRPGFRPAAPATPRSTIVVVPEVMAPTGRLSGVIGSPAAALTARFGSPRIDLTEGDARKLQFASATCVLDIYLYPVAAAAEPTATHVAARRRQGGAAADPGECLREIERR